jgi:magnesium transporter
VILAVFLPVMAGQTGNTGCQALAVTLRGMTLATSSRDRSAPWFSGRHARLLQRPAGRSGRRTGMTVYATMQSETEPWVFGMVVTFSMIVSCTVASIAGA